MNRKLRNAVFTWLRLQREGDDSRAEGALRSVFSLLPPESVPAGFSSRVLAQLGIAVAPAPQPAWRPNWVLRWVLCSCLLLGTWLTWFLPEVLPSVLALANPSWLIEFGMGAVVAITRRLTEGLIVWRVLADVSSRLTSILASPQYLAVLSSAALLSILAFRTLHGFIASERSSRYVGTV